MHEFEMIQTHFKQQNLAREDVILGIGDDAAIVKIPPDQELIITTDTLISGVHFPTNSIPFDIGYKALAVNLSDLAAMGALPAWFTLALTLPKDDEHWLHDFSRGLFTLANQFQMQLIGGDLTRGSLSITIQALGYLPKSTALRRDAAKSGDLIYVSGYLGDAGFALKILQNKLHLPEHDQHAILSRLNRPEPRIALGEKLRHIAHAAIDISDGLVADLSHILAASQVGAIVYVDQLPLSPLLKQALSLEDAIALALTAGDDYELCFTIPQKNKTACEKLLKEQHCTFACIGEITTANKLILRYQHGRDYHGATTGYQHF